MLRLGCGNEFRMNQFSTRSGHWRMMADGCPKFSTWFIREIDIDISSNNRQKLPKAMYVGSTE